MRNLTVFVVCALCVFSLLACKKKTQFSGNPNVYLEVAGVKTSSPKSSNTEKEASPDDFQVRLTDEGDGVIIMKYVGQGGKVVIPAEIQGFPVKTIAGGLTIGFAMNSKVTSVVIPDTVDYIGSYAFYYTSNLKSVKFPSKPVFIAPRAFLHSGISELTVTGNMEFGGYNPSAGSCEFFGECNSLEKIVFESDVEKVPYGFASSKMLKDIVFKSPETTVAVGAFAFRNDSGDWAECPNLSIATQAEIKKRTK